MSAVQLWLLEPHAPRPRLRHVRRPFTPTHLAADRTSCTKATANQFRLFLHAGAYWLMWSFALPDAEALSLACRAI